MPSSSTPPRPQVRADLLLRELDGEALVYDFLAHRAHCLNPSARVIFERCDGTRTIAELAESASVALGRTFTEELVRVALDELGEAGLLVRPPARRAVDHARRRVLGQLALTAGVAVAVPAVWSIVAPSQAEAASVVMCIATATCMTASSSTCCGTSGTAAMSCSGPGMCSGSGSSCMGAVCL